MSRVSNKSRRKKNATRSRFSPALLLGLGALLIAAALWAGDLGGIRTRLNRSGGTPHLQADKQIVDLGDVKLGEPVTVSFTLSNTGDGPLEFEEIPYIEVVEGC